MKNKIGIVSGVCILIALFITSLDIVSFDRNFYEKEYLKYNNAEVIGISSEELVVVTDGLLGYIQDDREDLHIEATIHGEIREVFNEVEIAHMVDVKDLYQFAISFRNVCLFVVFLITSYLLYSFKKEALWHITSGIIKGMGVFFAVFSLLAFFALVDFNTFWTMFHKVVFSNELWLLNPNTDILIMMVPLGFFYDLVFKIAGVFCVGALSIFGACLVLKRKCEGVL